jgi:hypothetical protein
VAGTVHAFPRSVNERDQVVGETEVVLGTPIIAALWVGGRTYDLTTLIAPSSLHLASAGYIDDQGDIVGSGFLPDGSQREFLLVRTRPYRCQQPRAPRGRCGQHPTATHRAFRPCRRFADTGAGSPRPLSAHC